MVKFMWNKCAAIRHDMPHIHPFAWLLIWRPSLRYIQWQRCLQIRKARSIFTMDGSVGCISHNFTLFLAASEHFLHELVVEGWQLSLFSAFHSPKFAASPILITSESLTDTGSTRAIKTWWVADGISRSFGSTAMQCNIRNLKGKTGKTWLAKGSSGVHFRVPCSISGAYILWNMSLKRGKRMNPEWKRLAKFCDQVASWREEGGTMHATHGTTSISLLHRGLLYSRWYLIAFFVLFVLFFRQGTGQPWSCYIRKRSMTGFFDRCLLEIL